MQSFGLNKQKKLLIPAQKGNKDNSCNKVVLSTLSCTIPEPEEQLLIYDTYYISKS